MKRMRDWTAAITAATLLATGASAQSAQARAHVQATVAPTALPSPISQPSVVTRLRAEPRPSAGPRQMTEYRTHLDLPPGPRFDVEVDRSGGDASVHVSVASDTGRFESLSGRNVVVVPTRALADGRGEVRYRIERSDGVTDGATDPPAAAIGSPPGPVVVTLVIARN